jgi:hypothetical protein
MISRFAPIALFAYRRVSHLARTLSALSRCPEFEASHIFAFSDGPNTAASDKDVAAVRSFLKKCPFPNLTIIDSPTNLGLAKSITAGVTQLCNEFGRVIVIEDDIVVAPSTLAWFNSALDRFEPNENVWQISAHQFPIPEFAVRQEGLFLHLTASWGWATWKRAWDRYDAGAKDWERLLSEPQLQRAFDLNGSYPYSRMLTDQMAGKLDSWAIRWMWSVFQENGLSLYPPRTLVRNIGFDSTGTHARFRSLKRLIPREQLRRLFTRRDNIDAIDSEVCPQLPQRVLVLDDDQRALFRAVAKSQRFSSKLKLVFFEEPA